MHAWQCLGRGLLGTGPPRPAQKGGRLTPFRAEKQQNPLFPRISEAPGHACPLRPLASAMLFSPTACQVLRRRGRGCDAQLGVFKAETDTSLAVHMPGPCLPHLLTPVSSATRRKTCSQTTADAGPSSPEKDCDEATREAAGCAHRGSPPPPCSESITEPSVLIRRLESNPNGHHFPLLSLPSPPGDTPFPLLLTASQTKAPLPLVTALF